MKIIAAQTRNWTFNKPNQSKTCLTAPGTWAVLSCFPQRERDAANNQPHSQALSSRVGRWRAWKRSWLIMRDADDWGWDAPYLCYPVLSDNLSFWPLSLHICPLRSTLRRRHQASATAGDDRLQTCALRPVQINHRFSWSSTLTSTRYIYHSWRGARSLRKIVNFLPPSANTAQK